MAFERKERKNKGRSPEEEYDPDATTYALLPNDDRQSRNNLLLVSNTKVIEALEKLYNKIKNFEMGQSLITGLHDVPGPPKVEKAAISNENDLRSIKTNHGGTYWQNIRDAQRSCDTIEIKLKDILQAVSTGTSKPQKDALENCATLSENGRSIPVSSRKSDRHSARPWHPMQVPPTKGSTSWKSRVKPVPFVTSGVAKPSFSMIANMQMLIGLLKMHNPYTQSLANPLYVTDQILAIVDVYLREIVSALRDDVGFAAIEMVALRRSANRAKDVDKVSYLQQRIVLLKRRYDSLVEHIREFRDLQNQVLNLRNGIRRHSDARGDETSKHRKENYRRPMDKQLLKHRERILSKMPTATETQLNYNTTCRSTHTDAMELLKCIHKLQLLLRL